MQTAMTDQIEIMPRLSHCWVSHVVAIDKLIFLSYKSSDFANHGLGFKLFINI